jgi:hypothetical protein
LSENKSKDHKEWEKAFSEGMTNMDLDTWRRSNMLMRTMEESGSFNCSCGGVTKDFVCNKCGTFFEKLFLKYRGDNKSDS